MKKILFLIFISLSIQAQKPDMDATFQTFDLHGKGLISVQEREKVGSLFYKNVRGDAEYDGNSTYQLNTAIGVIERIPLKTYFNQVRFRGYAASNTVGFISIYKATSLPAAPFNLSNGAFTLLKRVSLKAGEWNTSSSVYNTVNLDNIESVNANEYIIVLMQSIYGTYPTVLRWNAQSSTSPTRQGIVFNTTGDGTSYSTSFYYGTTTYFSTPVILDLVDSNLESKIVDFVPIPDTLFVATRYEMNLWKNALVTTNEGGGAYSIDYSASEGASMKRGYRITPTATGVMALSLLLKDKLLNTVKTVAAKVSKVSRNAGTGTKNILVVGDSFISANTIVQTIKQNADTCSGATYTMIGTQGSGSYMHEGRGGWTWNQYITSGSPFYISGALNFTTYCSNNSFSGIDVCVINLGTNDFFSGTKTVSDVNTVVGYAKTFLTALFAAYPSCKVVLSLPGAGGSQDGFGTDYGAGQNIEQFKKNMRLYWDAMIINFGSGKYSPNVRVAPTYLVVDKDYGFPTTSLAISARNATTENRISNGVHPNTSGYQQIGDMLFSYIQSFF